MKKESCAGISGAKTWLWLGLILAISLALRLFGLRHGISLHNDESSVVDGVLQLSFSNLRPKNYFYGSLTYYLPWILAQPVRWFTSFSGNASPWPSDFDSWVVWCRVISAIAGTASVWLTYVLARLLTKRVLVALASAAILGFNVLHIQLSHFYTSDILLVVASQWCLYHLVRWVQAPKPQDLWLAGAALGVGFACKISALFLGVAFATAILCGCFGHKLYRHKHGLRNTALQALVAGCIAGFLIVALQPYLVLDTAEYLVQVRDQAAMVRGEAQAPWNHQYVGSPAVTYAASQLLYYTVGIPLSVLGVIGLLALCLPLFSRAALTSGWLPILAWGLVSFFVMSCYQVKFLRYLLPLYPLLAILIAVGASKIDVLLSFTRIAVASFSAVLWSLFTGIAFSLIYLKPHIHVEASEWICQHVPAGKIIIQTAWDTQLPRCGHLPNFPQYQMDVPKYEGQWFEDLHRPDFNEYMTNLLASGDYIVLPSPRIIRGILAIPPVYPSASRLLVRLFSGQLGYTLEKTFTYEHVLGPYEFDDTLADESFSVHDHPKVWLFKNEERLSGERMRELVALQPLPEARSFDPLLATRNE